MSEAKEAVRLIVKDEFTAGRIGLVPARMELGTAAWRERWAYRFPRLLGHLDPEAAEERLTGIHPDSRRLQRTLRILAISAMPWPEFEKAYRQLKEEEEDG